MVTETRSISITNPHGRVVILSKVSLIVLATGARKMMIRRGFMIGYFTSLFSSSSLFKGASQAMLDVVAPIIVEQMNADFYQKMHEGRGMGCFE